MSGDFWRVVSLAQSVDLRSTVKTLEVNGFGMSKKTLQAAVEAVVGDIASGTEPEESELDSGGEADGDGEPESDGDSYGLSSVHSPEISDSLAPKRNTSIGNAGSGRTPFGMLQQSSTPCTPRCTTSKGKSVSLLRRFSVERVSHSHKKRRVHSGEQENIGSDKEEDNYEEDDSNTKALLLSLIKRIDRQEKRLVQMQQKMDQSGTLSSSCSGQTRSHASRRRKEVPLEVRVS